MTYLRNGPADARIHLILAHGAGEGPTSPFLTHLALALGAGGVRVTRFAFPYMVAMVAGGPRRPPDRQQVLLDAWQQAIAASRRPCMPPVLGVLPGAVPDAPCMPPVLGVLPGAVPDAPCMPPVLGGKSMGGRMASLIADQTGAAGLVCLGYPFHPPGRPERLRTEHLAMLRTPTLICQGERDPFGRPDEVARYDLSHAIRLAWIPDGDHSFKPRKRSGRTWEANLDLAAAEVLGFLNGL